ncbi:Sentrin-specific protease [Frankliniella fusca]|uniref:Sentrin-specific protease n=1 Tax=Frankliniella fusca TaxID=407009 RepID=A0AAE1H1T7_9NEOP|nr:Sentrin-specific protease [Frankliniella fusca]
MDNVDHVELPSRCKFCNSGFGSRNDCTQHEKTCDKFIVIPQCSSAASGSEVTPLLDKNACKSCLKVFTLRKNLLRHERSCSKNSSACEVFTCKLCGSKTKREDNFKSHIKKCNANNISKSRSKTPCLFPNCSEEFFRKISLIEHLNVVHNLQIQDPISKTFSSVSEFHLWKDEEQEKTFSYFSQKSGQNASKIKYFYCQHDGVSHSQRKTSRLNLKGRVKVGHHCIAKMQVWKNSEEEINVLYYPTHSHICTSADFVHHPLSKKDNLYINERIAWGVSPTKILRDVQKKVIPKSSSTQEIQNCKASIISKKRIRERARKRREKMRYHKDEAYSLYLMVQKLQEEDDCIVLYKPYGDDVHIGSEDINSLKDHKDLFMLGLQTKRQAQLLADHSHKVVLVDETHGTNHHKFQLLSLMIVDDNRRGWPVGHLVTSKSDKFTLQYFFKAISSNAPSGVDLKLNCVITDDDPALINGMDLGFCGELGKIRHILCKWHLLRAFKKNLRLHVPQAMVDDMMTELRVLVNERDKNVFTNLQSGFIAKYKDSPHCKTFIKDYYCKYYEHRVEKWAMSYRVFPHANINTTGHIESFHHRLKKVYLKRKVNRRLDDLVQILLDIEWDDHVARVRESTIGMAFQPQDILMRHKRGMAIPDEDLQKIDETTWDIKASSSKNSYYIVHYSDSCTADHCFSKCSQVSCGSLCAHMYSCSCKDNNPLCKHIHKMHSFRTRSLVKQVRDNESCVDNADADALLVETPIIPPAATNNSENRRTLSRNIHDLEGNLFQLSDFFTSSKDGCNSLGVANAIAHAAAVTTELLLQLQYMAHDVGETNIVPMEPAIKFNSNEKLKTQASQVPSFKRPPAKRKIKPSGDSPTKKKAVVKDLLSILNAVDKPDDPSPMENFTPDLSFVSNPCDVVLKCCNEKITLLNLKSLEPHLTDEETQICKKLDLAFNVGWLYSSVINAYLDFLGEKYPSTVHSLSSDLALRASRGFSNFQILQKIFGSAPKDVALLPLNLSGNHWCIIAIHFDLVPAQVWYYDPLQASVNSSTENVLFQLCADLKQMFPAKSEWDTVIYVQSEKQMDTLNCGPYICSFAEQMSRKARPYHLNNNINYFRKEIFDSIVGNCLKAYDAEQCPVCLQKYLDTEDDKNWISCIKCDQWFHYACVGHSSSSFVCPSF